MAHGIKPGWMREEKKHTRKVRATVGQQRLREQLQLTLESLAVANARIEYLEAALYRAQEGRR
jgi:hypothetical protein